MTPNSFGSACFVVRPFVPIRPYPFIPVVAMPSMNER